MTESETGGPEDGSSATRRLYAFVREHPGLVLSGGYLSATAIGMLSSVTYYGRFGVNIFHYAQLSDFIVAAVRNPLATAAIVAAIPAVWLIMVSDAWLDRRFGWYKWVYGPRWLRAASRSRPAWVLYFVVYAWAFTVLHSGWIESRVRAGMVPRIQVELQAGTYLGRDATQPFETALLGTTSTHAFLFDQAFGAVTVVPFENVARFTTRAPRGDGRAP